MEANDYPRRILLAVTGLSPQVVTETLYALMVAEQPAFAPTEVHLITTKEGAERARHSLLNPTQGQYHRFCRDYGVQGVAFDLDQVHVMDDERGEALEDIRTLSDNAHAADAITEWVRQFTSDRHSAVHVSIAGGRKTMGFYLGYALSLYGRPQDRLSHVLVSPPYESNPEFYYPTPDSYLIHTRGDNPRAHDAREAEVTLAEIPFVRLREGLPERLQAGKASFSQTVAVAQRALEAPRLMIDLNQRAISVSGEIIELPPADLAFYSWMARRNLRDAGFIRHDDPETATDYLNELAGIISDASGEYERAETALRKGMDNQYFDQRKAHTNKAIRAALPAQLARIYEIGSEGRRPRTRYGLKIEAGAIQYEAIEA